MIIRQVRVVLLTVKNTWRSWQLKVAYLEKFSFAYSSYQNPWSKTNWWKTNEWTISTTPWSSVQSTKMSPSFLASRDKLGQLKKKPSFPISTNRDETLKRMVITTLPIMMIISSFNQKKHTHSHVNEKKNWDLFWARSETEMVGPGILDLYRASQICFHVNLSWFLFL